MRNFKPVTISSYLRNRHRLAMLRRAGRIIVKDVGRIVEEGDCASPTAGRGLYVRLTEQPGSVRR